MSTLTKEICETIIVNDGYYPGDRVAYSHIVTYNNMFNGGLSWAAIRVDEDPRRYHNSEACSNVQVYWTRGSGLNPDWEA